MKIIVALGLALALSACASQMPPPRPALSPPPPAPLVPIDPAQACLADLRRLNVDFEVVRDPQGAGDCAIENPVKVSAAAMSWNQAGVIACPMAQAMVRFENEVVQQAAWRNLGQPVVKVFHFGTYSCRNQRNRSRLSMHAKGQAIDVSGFQTADGQRISVAKDWRVPGPKSVFLRDVAQRACDVFNVVLTPNSDRDHHDHFHLDIGPYRLCAR
jgi:hypothetical protein